MPSRYEREIEELLRKIEGLPPKKSWSERIQEKLTARVEGYRSNLSRQLRTLTLGKMMAGALVLLLLAFWLRSHQGLATILLLSSVGLFAYAYLSSFSRRRYPRVEKRWRGNLIELPRRTSYPWTSLVRKWRFWWATRQWRGRRW